MNATEIIIFWTLLFVSALIVFGTIGELDRNTAQAMHEHHCNMVKLHKIDSSVGWPDYDDRCSDD